MTTSNAAPAPAHSAIASESGPSTRVLRSVFGTTPSAAVSLPLPGRIGAGPVIVSGTGDPTMLLMICFTSGLAGALVRTTAIWPQTQ